MISSLSSISTSSTFSFWGSSSWFISTPWCRAWSAECDSVLFLFASFSCSPGWLTSLVLDLVECDLPILLAVSTASCMDFWVFVIQVYNEVVWAPNVCTVFIVAAGSWGGWNSSYPSFCILGHFSIAVMIALSIGFLSSRTSGVIFATCAILWSILLRPSAMLSSPLMWTILSPGYVARVSNILTCHLFKTFFVKRDTRGLWST